MQMCEGIHTNATCCKAVPGGNVTADAAYSVCPLTNCEEMIEAELSQAVKIVGCLGLIFSFTEVCYLHSTVELVSVSAMTLLVGSSSL